MTSAAETTTGGAARERPCVVVLDYGAGNVHSVVRALEAAGARVKLSAEPDDVMDADGLVVPGVGAFEAVMDGLRSVQAPRLIDRRLSGGRPVLGICVGLQVMFDEGVEHGRRCAGLAQWPGTVQRLDAPVVPHMGWNTVQPPSDSSLFRGIADERFYFVHSYGVREWTFDQTIERMRAPGVTWSEHGAPFIAAVENGALCATQFHPEKSSRAGVALLRNWLETVPRTGRMTERMPQRAAEVEQ